MLTRWEIVEPVVHRPPMPEPLLRAMVALAIFRGWERWAGVVLITFYGVMRIGDVITAPRRCLLLPVDFLDPDANYAFMRVEKPKSGQRGGAKVQHARIRGEALLSALAGIFAGLQPGDRLYPLSAAAFRTRWNILLRMLGVPSSARLTPGGLRGGGAVAAYRLGMPIQDLMWQMRLKHSSTLEHYLQEVAAVSALANLPDAARSAILAASQSYPSSLTLAAKLAEHRSK